MFSKSSVTFAKIHQYISRVRSKKTNIHQKPCIQNKFLLGYPDHPAYSDTVWNNRNFKKSSYIGKYLRRTSRAKKALNFFREVMIKQ